MQTKLRNYRFLVEREGGHTQIVTVRAATPTEALHTACVSNPGVAVERYSAELARAKGATEHPRKWAGTRYELGSTFDPETWNEGDILIDRRGDRSLVTGPLGDSGYLPMVHLAPGEKYDLEAYSLHVAALTNTYGYRLEGQSVGDTVPAFEGQAANDPTRDTADDILAMVKAA
jgi:hypothetical protein